MSVVYLIKFLFFSSFPRYRTFMEDPRNIAWIAAAVVLGAVTSVAALIVVAKYLLQGPRLCKKSPKKTR